MAGGGPGGSAIVLAGLLAGVAVAGCVTGEGLEDAPYAFAQLLLTEEYPELIVEFHHMAGYAPSEFALAEMKAIVKEATQKQQVTLVPSQKIVVEESSRGSIAAEKIHARTAQHGKPWYENHPGNPAVVHVLFLDGEDLPDSAGYYALTGGQHVIVIFPDVIRERMAERYPLLPDSLRVQKEQEAERAVLIHEMGHAMGLVGMGLPMVKDRMDPGGHPGGHSTNKSSVMASQVPRVLVRDDADAAMEGYPRPYRFDYHDLEDIRTYQTAYRAGLHDG